MTVDEIWDSFLLPLADLFEAGNRRYMGSDQLDIETFEPVRECLAIKIAEGSLTDFQGMGAFQFTAAGYSKYKARVDFLRAFPTATSE
jgi:hypothetical protein